MTLSLKAWGLMALLALIWGASFLSIRIALDEMGPFWVVAHRVSWATALLWAVALATAQAPGSGARLWLAFAGMGLLNNILPFSLMAWGQLHVETGLTAILNAATAIWGVLLAALLLPDERLGAAKAMGVALGFAGVVTALGWGNLASFDPRTLGQVAIVGGTVSYGLAAVWARRRLQGVAPVTAATGMLTTSMVMAIPTAWAIEGPPAVALASETWLAIGYFAVVATALAYLIYYRLIALAGSGNTMLTTLLIAPVAIVLGAWVRGEALGLNAYAGFGLLALGLACIARAGARQKALALADAPR